MSTDASPPLSVDVVVDRVEDTPAGPVAVLEIALPDGSAVHAHWPAHALPRSVGEGQRFTVTWTATRPDGEGQRLHDRVAARAVDDDRIDL